MLLEICRRPFENEYALSQGIVGLHDTNHYSTVKDIAKLLEYALQSDIFREVYTLKRYTIKATNLHSDGITLQSTMFKKINLEDVNNGTIEGGKTG